MLTVRKGQAADYEAIASFIEVAGSSLSSGCMYILAENERKDIIGVVGLKRYGDSGLLRSFICSPAFPPLKLPVFLERMLILAREQQCQEIYLATNLSSGQIFFETLGFCEWDRQKRMDDDLSTDITNLIKGKETKIMCKNLSL